jgi:hypothetical protein
VHKGKKQKNTPNGDCLIENKLAPTHGSTRLWIIKFLFPCGEEYSKRNPIKWKWTTKDFIVATSSIRRWAP